MVNEIHDITTNFTSVRQIIRGYYEQVYTYKFDNLDEMHQFLKNHKLPELTQGKIDNLNSPILLKKLNLLFKKPFKRKAQDPENFSR